MGTPRSVRPFPALAFYIGLHPCRSVQSYALMPNPSPKRVLVVDDNRDAADTTAQILAIYGHITATAYNGAEGLRTAETFGPDVIFLDLGLPGMNGFEVAVAVRLLPKLSHVSLVALTAWGDAETKRLTDRAGFDHHLVKPAHPDTLLRTIAFS